MSEILAQAYSFTDYWNRLLMADNGRRPYTATLVQIGIIVGQLVGIYWKDQFKRMRPAQAYPALLPVIPTPSHPSYPSNHSTQAHLVAACVGAAMPATVRPAFGFNEFANIHKGVIAFANDVLHFAIGK